MPSPQVILYRRQRGLCPSCGRMPAAYRRGSTCEQCEGRLARWRAAKRPPSLGARIRARRLALGYTQHEFGVLLGTNAAGVSRLERDAWRWPPSTVLQARMARVLRCRLEEVGQAVHALVRATRAPGRGEGKEE